jgi:ubiquinone/menaquinone biosynthesis C-methylase UbiE
MAQMSSSSSPRKLDIPEGEHCLSAEDLIARLDLREGITVAELEADSGYFTIPIGHHIGTGGKVFAVESRPALLDRLRMRLCAPAAPANVEALEGSAALPNASCDTVLLADVFHALEDKDAALDEAKRILRADGHLCILDWRHDGVWPPGPALERRVSLQKAICIVEMKSWSLDYAREIGPNGYLLILYPTDESVQS